MKQLILCLYFLSGFSALLYQVIWQRIITLTIGVDTFSVSLIVAIFMLGLGFGSLLGGALADRLSSKTALFVFVVLEALIGSFALYSKVILYDSIYLSSVHLNYTTGVLAAIYLLILLLPTVCMGATLPILSRAIANSLTLAPREVSVIYGMNICGAAFGALISGFYLVRLFGFETTTKVGAILNFSTAIIIMSLLPFIRKERNSPIQSQEHADSVSKIWAYAYLSSGFINLGLEILWFRILGTLLKSNAFTFSYLLFLYLIGLAAGILTSTFFNPRPKQPGFWFLRLQLAAIIFSGFSLVVLTFLLNNSSVFGNIRAYLSGYEHVLISTGLSNSSRVFFALYAVIAPLLICIPTYLIGFSFVFLQEESIKRISGIGKTLGGLQAFNIVGSTLGSLIVGLILLEYLGTITTLRLIILLSLFYLCVLVKLGCFKFERYAFLSCILLTVYYLPTNIKFLELLHGSLSSDRISVAEDGTGVAALKAEGGNTYVFTNGLGQSWIPFGSIHSSLGIFPLFVHPNPKNIAVIGLGSGDTLFSSAGRRGIDSVKCFEIVKPLRSLLKDHTSYPGLVGISSNPIIDIIYGDGRKEIAKSSMLFDIIEADALRPTSAYSGNLYSKEYFELLRSKLAPGGYAVSWIPTERTLRTFMNVFEHTLLFPYVAIGSKEKIVFDKEEVLARAKDAYSRNYYKKAGIDHIGLIEDGSKNAQILGQDLRKDLDINTDFYPKDEFNT
jgi:spermidine synthase